MIDLVQYRPELAVEVFRNLDGADRMEADALRDPGTHFLGLFGDWHNAARHAIESGVFVKKSALGNAPFAVIALANTGIAGVAEGAFLAADHSQNFWSIGRAAVFLKRHWLSYMAERQIHRIEARCDAAHPRASRLLEQIGFEFCCNLPGYGRDGSHTFKLYALTAERKHSNV